MGLLWALLLIRCYDYYAEQTNQIFLANFVKMSVLLASRGLHAQFYLDKNMIYCHNNCDVPSSGIMKREDSYVTLLQLRTTS
jgi:hypothetical protein